jgi:hypothetical protein
MKIKGLSLRPFTIIKLAARNIRATQAEQRQMEESFKEEWDKWERREPPKG